MPINDPEKSENMRKSIRVYSGSSNRPLAQKIAEYLGVELSGLTLKQFANGEIYARYDETVRGADVFLIQSVAGGNVNDMLMELLIATDAAKRASARSITAVITHYGYARQDRKAGPREPITARLVANLLERAGVNRIITLDLHQGQIQGSFDIPVNHLSALPLFGPVLQRHALRHRQPGCRLPRRGSCQGRQEAVRHARLRPGHRPQGPSAPQRRRGHGHHR